MCGVVAVASVDALPDLALVSALLRQSRIRGTHAFGWASCDSGGEMTAGKAHAINDCLASLPPEPCLLIAHTRYSTSGDWLDHRNNQPVIIGQSALVFNGIIDMRTRAEYETARQRKYSTDNDGEILLDMVLRGEPWLALLTDQRVSLAGAWIVE